MAQMAAAIAVGVRHCGHESRKYGVQQDKYFAIRHQSSGVREEEGSVRASQAWRRQKSTRGSLKEGQSRRQD